MQPGSIRMPYNILFLLTPPNYTSDFHNNALMWPQKVDIFPKKQEIAYMPHIEGFSYLSVILEAESDFPFARTKMQLSGRVHRT